MIKRYIKLLIGLVIVAVIAVGAYVWVTVNKNNEIKKAYEEETKKSIFVFDPMNIKTMRVHNSSGDFVFSLTEDGWIISEGEQFPVNPNKFVTMSEAMSNLTASRILTEELPDDLNGYGLEDPLTVCMVLKDGTEYSLDIGGMIPGGTDYYTRVTGQNTIYVLPEDDVLKLKAEVDDLKDNYLFDASSTDSITSLKYMKNGTIVYDLRKENGDWKLFTPFPQGAVNGANVANITSQIIRAQCTTFINEEMNDLSKFGFDNPQYQLEITTDDKEADVIFGNYYDDNHKYIYAYNRTVNQIYIFETAVLGFVDTQIEDVLNKQIHSEFFGNIKSFDINIFGEEIKIDYQYSASGEGDTYYAVNGKKVDAANEDILAVFNNLINSITGMNFEKICENVNHSEISKEPDASITYHLKEGEDYRLEFIKKDDTDNMYYIIENGKYNGTLLRKASLESGVLKYYEEILDLI